MKKLFIFSVTIFICIACANKHDAGEICKEGLMLYYGDPAVGGCGWRVKVKDTIYSPTELDAEFQYDSLKVCLNYCILSPNSYCGWGVTDYPKIEILDIKTSTNF
jgi:hypothetical protein